ncbi:MAG: dephospho-CoA kinase [Gammaproteobacteria bacterium]|nr:dephospho-CoA kinase [Gammaproteobacteria bacterium]MBU1731737.1 dephospho-CoA kinase [Gammaproteobacteria bacterium]MBU1892561.1 dephospho-CoA kinase [Gammaproteobacteria bacterium]
MLVIGLTGGVGCGKSAVADLFTEQGISIIDTDLIARQLTSAGEPSLAVIANTFGTDFLLPDGELNRSRLRHLIFSTPEAKKKLEAILHPMIRDEVRRRLALAQSPYVIVAVPLLLENGTYREMVQRVLVVDCSETQQVERVIARNGLNKAEVRAIMAHQLAPQERLRQADDVVDNHGSRSALRSQVEHLHQRYIKLAAAQGC